MARFAALAVLALLLAVSAPRAAEALTCGEVVTFLLPCIPYVRGETTQMPSSCCEGVRNLNGKAQTTPDRQVACNCLKSNVASIKGVDMNIASGVPGKCGVSVPYPINTSVDCSTVK